MSHANCWLFLCATPLHYLAARKVASLAPAGTRRVLVWYKPSLETMVDPGEWDAALAAPWPRFAPMPGPMGRHRRLLANLDTVAAAIGRCDELVIHSPVFDTEAINYYLHGLPPMVGARTMHARILPDGLLNIQRYPLSAIKRIGQYLRKLRRLISPRLDYWCFSGDRIGSDAPFVDRIYTLAGFPHRYPPHKVVALPPLADSSAASTDLQDTALVIGQPLVGIGAMSRRELDAVSEEIGEWIRARGIERIHYKQHPRDHDAELCLPHYRRIELDEALESHMARHRYAAIIGVCSTALFTARQIYGPQMPILAFGMDRMIFKGEGKKAGTEALMENLDIRIMPAPRDTAAQADFDAALSSHTQTDRKSQD